MNCHIDQWKYFAILLFRILWENILLWSIFQLAMTRITEYPFNHFTLSIWFHEIPSILLNAHSSFFFSPIFCLFSSSFIPHAVKNELGKNGEKGFCYSRFLSRKYHIVEWIVDCLTRNHNIVSYRHDWRKIYITFCIKSVSSKMKYWWWKESLKDRM